MKPVAILPRLVFSALILLAIPFAARADGVVSLMLNSVSEGRSYGLYLQAAPEEECDWTRYRVMRGGRMLAETPLIRPGQGVVLRLGQGFAPGAHLLEIRAVGCAQPLAALRRVVFAKTSPDHGWRAGS